VQDARQRGQRSESLRRIASLVVSSATLDEILHFSVHELSQLLRADVGAIYLLDDQTHELQLHPESTWGVWKQTREICVSPLSLARNAPSFPAA
jgi:GAF domain-containing protein